MSFIDWFWEGASIIHRNCDNIALALIDGFLQQKKIFDADLNLHVTCFVVLTVCYFFEINFISIEMLFIGDLKECQQCPVVQNS